MTAVGYKNEQHLNKKMTRYVKSNKAAVGYNMNST